MPAKRIGFYVELPKLTVAAIKRMAAARKDPQWMVVADAVTDAEVKTFVLAGGKTAVTGGPRCKARGARG